MTIQLTDTNQNSLLISAVNLELFAFRATHRLLQYIVKKINQPDLILSFRGVKYIKTSSSLSKAEVKILNEHEAQIFNDVLKFMKIDFSHSKAYLLSGSEGKCLIIAEDVSIESAESVDDWFTKSVNSPLKTGYFSPIEIEDFSTQIIQQLQEKEF